LAVRIVDEGNNLTVGVLDWDELRDSLDDVDCSVATGG
jgi:hypothetical protein